MSYQTVRYFENVSGGGSCTPGPSNGGCCSSARDIGYAGDMLGNESMYSTDSYPLSRTVRFSIGIIEMPGYWDADSVINRRIKKEIKPWEVVTRITTEKDYDTMSVIVTANVRPSWPNAPTVLG